MADYAYSDFGGGGGGGGYDNEGGYMNQNSSPGQGAGSGRKGGAGSYKPKTIVPVTIKQLSMIQPTPSGDAYMLDTAELHQVQLLARLEQVQDLEAGSVALHINDSTGVVVIEYYPSIDDLSWAETRGSLVPGVYVAIVATVKMVGGTAKVHALNIVAVHDHNRITHHNLAALLATLERQQGQLQPHVQPGAAAASAYGAGASSWNGGASSAGQYGQAISMGGGGGGAGGEPKQAAIIAAFEADRDKDEGSHVSFIAKQVAHMGMTHDEVAGIIEGLCTEGIVYTTVDEYHYKLTS